MTLDEVFCLLSTLETARLRIRPLQMTDSETMHEIKSNPKVTGSYGEEPHKSLEDTRVWVQRRLEDYAKREVIFWVLTLKENDKTIGGCCFWNFDHTFRCAEIGYELHPVYWNLGITSEALPGGFEIRL
jgi:[ribosomal protein S5]-alanine N-acetyltransferase